MKRPTKDHGRTLAHAVGLALKAWLLPRLNKLGGIDLSLHWDALEFISPPESPKRVEASWEGISDFARHFAVQQEKMLAFACGLHVRLGAASFGVSLLNDQVLVMVADAGIFTLPTPATRPDCAKCGERGIFTLVKSSWWQESGLHSKRTREGGERI